jgi:hypothetical protein
VGQSRADQAVNRIFEGGDHLSPRLRLPLSIAAAVVLFVVTSMPLAGQQGRGGGGAAAQGGRGGANEAAPAGPIPRRPDGKPDLSGNWSGRAPEGGTSTVILENHPGGFGITAGHSLIIDPTDEKIPYQPWALVERDRRRDDANGYEDPVGHCEFYDIGRIHSFDQEIMYSGDFIIFNVQQHITRVFDMRRREHLPAAIRLWDGDPVARWEGDTLVVDSTNFNGRTRMALGGDFYSPNAHIVERWTMPNSNTIRWTMTIDDPAVFTRPWTMTSAVPMQRLRGPATDFDDEDTCHEGNVDLAHLRNTYEQAHGPDAPWVRVAPIKP